MDHVIYTYIHTRQAAVCYSSVGPTGQDCNAYRGTLLWACFPWFITASIGGLIEKQGTGPIILADIGGVVCASPIHPVDNVEGCTQHDHVGVVVTQTKDKEAQNVPPYLAAGTSTCSAGCASICVVGTIGSGWGSLTCCDVVGGLGVGDGIWFGRDETKYHRLVEIAD